MPELLPCPRCERHSLTKTGRCDHCSAPLLKGLTAAAVIMTLSATTGCLSKNVSIYGSAPTYEAPLEESGDTSDTGTTTE